MKRTKPDIRLAASPPSWDLVGCKYYFYIKDHLGNNRIVTDRDGNILQSTDYYPYGLPTPDAVSTETQPYKYNGKEFIETGGLDEDGSASVIWREGNAKTITVIAFCQQSIGKFITCQRRFFVNSQCAPVLHNGFVVFTCIVKFNAFPYQFIDIGC
ncbi:hypothetical protein FACS1894180_4330 [Bacteroidia bacterium]|nr:hypothetical protein FACS1894180_4330 [Bacteroidia bacterium]